VKRIRVIALIAGLATDLIGTIIVSAVVTFAFMMLPSSSGQRLETFLQTLLSDPLFLAIGYAVGIAFTLLGAYIAARMSRPYSMLNTLIFGVISTLLIVFFGSMYPVWYNVLSILTVIPVSLVPGYLLARQTV